jgi:thioredoxin 1
MLQHFTNENWQTEVIEASKTKPVLVDFFATWCPPCQILGPVIEALANEVGDKAVVGKLDTDQSMELARQHNIMSIPTIIVFRNGEPAERLVGVQEKETLMTLLTK